MVCLADVIFYQVYQIDISKWNQPNAISFFYIFSGCIPLIYLTDISVYETSRAEYLYNLFDNFLSLISISDIFKWNIIGLHGDNMF